MSEPRALAPTLAAARRGRLYPALILHGGADTTRREAAALVARTLLCERAPEARPCGECKHCRRIVAPPLPDGKPDPGRPFHPDFAVLERDLKTSTSAESARDFLRVAHSSPFEARGQVFVVAEAHTLSGEAGDALLKLLEEPGLGAPRHFLLLAPSRLDLPATLRSRSQSVFLGPAEPPPAEAVAALAGAFGAAVVRFGTGGNALYLLEAAARLAAAGDFDDPRATRPWTLAAAAVRDAADGESVPVRLRRPLLELAEDLLAEAPMLRLRGIPPERILDGFVSRRLAR